MSDPERSLDLVKRVLGKDYTRLEIANLKVEDNLRGECSVELLLAPDIFTRGEGVGQVDAIFCALKTQFAREYKSLVTIELTDLNIELNRNTGNRRDGTDAECITQVTVRNSWGSFFEFTNSSCSLAASAAQAVAAAVEFFINSEKAFCVLRRALQDAMERDRQDLVTKYTGELSNITKNTSYKEV